MPDLDGAEVTRRIRQLPHGADVPVVVVTAYDDRDFRLQALEAGATDFLLAPLSITWNSAPACATFSPCAATSRRRAGRRNG